MSHSAEKDVERIIAETLCPPSHREGMVTHIIGQPAKFGPTRICVLHSVMAKNIMRALVEARAIPPVERDCNGYALGSSCGCASSADCPASRPIPPAADPSDALEGVTLTRPVSESGWSTPPPASESVEVVRGWRTYDDGSISPVERWVKHADGDWVSLDSTRRTSGDILIDPTYVLPPEMTQVPE